jgi:hypothetical protein
VTIGPAIFQIVYNNVNFDRNQQNDEISRNLKFINVAICLLTLISTGLLLMAAGTEPGIIPRHIDLLMESIPPAYRELAEKQENRKRYVINKKQLIDNQAN